MSRILYLVTAKCGKYWYKWSADNFLSSLIKPTSNKYLHFQCKKYWANEPTFSTANTSHSKKDDRSVLAMMLNSSLARMLCSLFSNRCVSFSVIENCIRRTVGVDDFYESVASFRYFPIRPKFFKSVSSHKFIATPLILRYFVYKVAIINCRAIYQSKRFSSLKKSHATGIFKGF